jgi:metal-sulfur cluster biosynthetic enzyme
MTDTPTREALIRQLRKVTEPCSIAMRSPTNIWDMGLVEDLAVEGGHARVVLCLTDPGCVHLTGMRSFITDVLLELDGIKSVEVCQAQNVMWTPDRIQHSVTPG